MNKFVKENGEIQRKDNSLFYPNPNPSPTCRGRGYKTMYDI